MGLGLLAGLRLRRRLEDERPGAPPPEPDYSAMRVSIASVGDMMIGTDYPENHLPDDDGVGFLAGVAPWLWPWSASTTRAAEQFADKAGMAACSDESISPVAYAGL